MGRCPFEIEIVEKHRKLSSSFVLRQIDMSVPS